MSCSLTQSPLSQKQKQNEQIKRKLHYKQTLEGWRNEQKNGQMDIPKFIYTCSKVVFQNSINWIERRLDKLEELKTRVNGIEEDINL